MVFNDLKKIWVGGEKLKISRVHVGEDGRASPNKTLTDPRDFSTQKKKKKSITTQAKKKKRKPKDVPA